jgi:restriction endonuclease S subunit
MKSDVLKDNETFRIDGEYFKKDNLAKLRQIEALGYHYIGENAFVTDGIHESITFDEDSNILLLSAKAPKENIFDLSKLEKIAQQQHDKNPRTALQVDDIIISTVGTIGNVAVVTPDILPANSDRHVGIIRIKNPKISPYFVSTFLLSKYGRFQTWREATGNVQLNLFIYKIKTLKLPNLTFAFQQTIELTVKKAHHQSSQAQELYQQAERVLLEELGLVGFKPSTQGVSIKTFAQSFGTTGRLDAEYYQPKYDDLLARIQSYRGGVKKLKTLGTFKNGSLISDEFYTTIGKRAYLRIKELSFNSSIQDDKVMFIKDDYVQTNETTVKTNDFIIATIGNTIGKVNLITEKYNNSFISNNTSKFSLDDDNTEFYYWEILLKSFLAQEQVQREFTQTAQPKISNFSLEEIVVPILPLEKQQEIAGLVQESFRLKTQSEALLEVAKRGVELAIETTEAQAQSWMQAQLEALTP